MNINTYNEVRQAIFEREYRDQITVSNRDHMLSKLDMKMICESTDSEFTLYLEEANLYDRFSDKIDDIVNKISKADKIDPMFRSTIRECKELLKDTDDIIEKFDIQKSDNQKSNRIYKNIMGIIKALSNINILGQTLTIVPAVAVATTTIVGMTIMGGGGMAIITALIAVLMSALSIAVGMLIRLVITYFHNDAVLKDLKSTRNKLDSYAKTTKDETQAKKCKKLVDQIDDCLERRSELS